MHATKKIVAAGLSVGFLAAGYLTLTAAAIAADMSVIKQRIDLMEQVNGKGFNVIKDFVQAGKGSPADVKKAAEAMAASAAKIPSLFVKGTGRPDVDAKKTRAEATIWQDWAGFEAAAKALGDEAAKMAKLADGGDKAAIGDQLKALGRNGCGGCHKKFKGEEVK